MIEMEIYPIHHRISNNNTDDKYFYELEVIDNWKRELNRLINMQDDSIESYLPSYSIAIKLLSNHKIIILSYGLTLYSVILLVICNGASNTFSPGLNPDAVPVALASFATFLNTSIIKSSVFGSLLNNNGDKEVGYYELLDAQIKFLSNKVRSEKMKNSVKSQYLWISLLCADFVGCLGFLVYFNCKDSSTKFSRIYQIATFGHSTLYLADFLNIAQAILTVGSLIHGSLPLMDLCDDWVDQFMRYKSYSKLEFQQLLGEVNSKRATPLTLVAVQKNLFERYLFIVGILSKTSDIWSFGLACYMAACLFAFLILAYFAYTTSSALFYFYEFLVLFFMLLLISSISYANSAMSLLKSSIKSSVPPVNDNDLEGDFSVLGGRKLWLDYIDEVPCYWTIYGFALTPQWLQGFVTGALVTIVVSLIPVLVTSAVPA